jgi:hypothetical protein
LISTHPPAGLFIPSCPENKHPDSGEAYVMLASSSALRQAEMDMSASERSSLELAVSQSPDATTPKSSISGERTIFAPLINHNFSISLFFFPFFFVTCQL